MAEDKVTTEIYPSCKKETKSDFSCQSSCGGNGEVIHDPNKMVVI
ncbi:MAG: hypothetical protein ACFFBJ_12730 [Promethearchaeota archaeon]